MAKFVPFIIKTDGSQNISVKIVRMKKSDAVQTEKEPVWQTSWLSDYIQDDAFEKYALKTSNGELVAHDFHTDILTAVCFYNKWYKLCHTDLFS